MSRKSIALAAVILAIAAYHLSSGEMPDSEPTGENTLVVGKVEYFLTDDFKAYSSNEFELSVRSSKTGSFKVTTDEDGFFYFPVWAGSKVWITDIESRGVKVLSVPQVRLRRLQFTSSGSGVSNIGTIYWWNYDTNRPFLRYGFNSGNKYFNSLANASPGSLWLQEEWYRIELESSNNNF